MKREQKKKGFMKRAFWFFVLLLACTGTTTTTQKGCNAREFNPCDQDLDGYKAVGWITYVNAYGKNAMSYCSAAPLAQRDCNDKDPNNWKSCSTCIDNDGDGYFTGCDAYLTIKGPDCNDANVAINPGAAEVCNGYDDNCDGQMLDGETVDMNQNGILACLDPNDKQLQATVEIVPEAFNENTGKFTAFVQLPAPFDTSTIISCIADGAVAISISYDADSDKTICKFNRDDVAENPLDTLFQVSGETSGGLTFVGTDTINKIVE